MQKQLMIRINGASVQVFINDEQGVPQLQEWAASASPSDIGDTVVILNIPETFNQ